MPLRARSAVLAAVAVAATLLGPAVALGRASAAEPVPGPATASAQAAPQPARRVVFVGDYDTGDFCQWSTLQNAVQNASACSYKQTHYSAKVVDGGEGHRTAARFELRDGDVPNVPGGERAEVRAGKAGDVVDGDERSYEFSLKFADDFPNPTGTYMVVMQWHPVTGPPPLAVEVDGAGNLVLTNAREGSKKAVIGKIQRGKWVRYGLHVRFSDNPSVGFVEASENGVTVVRRTPWRGMPTASNYLKEGLYRDKADSRTAVLWHDDLRVSQP